MNDKYIQWFCAEIFDNWKVEVNVKSIYDKFKQEFPTVDQETAIDCMTKAVKIVGASRMADRKDHS